MDTTPTWPDANRFLATSGLLSRDGASPGQMMRALDDANYWPGPWPVSRKRSHIRWMMRRCADENGDPRFIGLPAGRPPRLTLPRGYPDRVLSAIEHSEWRTLETIRHVLLGADLLDPNESEQQHIEFLELFLGTEERYPDPVLSGADGFPRVACVTDPNVVDPEPLYKIVGAWWTEADAERHAAHLRRVATDLKRLADTLERSVAGEDKIRKEGV